MPENPEAVIVAAARTPIGRAHKGSLTQERPDDMSALIIRLCFPRCLRWIPQTWKTSSGDARNRQVSRVTTSPACPACWQGFTLPALPSIAIALPRFRPYEWQLTPSAQVKVTASSPGGVEAVSRFGSGLSDGAPNTQNPHFDEALARSATRATGEGGDWTDQPGLPDIYIAMGKR